MMKRIGIGILVFGLVLVIGTAAQAVPSLGVGGALQTCTGEYWTCFVGNSASGSGESFALPASGGQITLWSNIGFDIWLVGESSLGNITFTPTGGSTETPDTFTIHGGGGKLTGYQGTPYQAIDLGGISSSLWVPAAPLASPFDTGQDPFYFLRGTITYTGTNTTGDWLFLVASSNSELSQSRDVVSPKTTSMVPEPGTVLLLGSGLLGLVIYRRKFQA